MKRVARTSHKGVARAISCEVFTAVEELGAQRICLEDYKNVTTRACAVLVIRKSTDVTDVDVVIERFIKRKAQLAKETQEITAAIRTLTIQRENFSNEDCGLVRKESGWN